MSLLRRKSIREILSGRQTFILDKPVVQNLNPRDLNPPGQGADLSLEKMRENKKAEWRIQGYSENQIKMATKLADDWTASMSDAFAPPEVHETVTRHNYPKGLDTASKWLEGLRRWGLVKAKEA